MKSPTEARKGKNGCSQEGPASLLDRAELVSNVVSSADMDSQQWKYVIPQVAVAAVARHGGGSHDLKNCPGCLGVRRRHYRGLRC